MKSEKMLRAIGQIDDDMIEDAAIQPGKKKQPLTKTPAFRSAIAIAAGFVLVVGLAFPITSWLKPDHEGPGVPTNPGDPNHSGTSGDSSALLPPNVQENQTGLQINSLDQMSYYAAVRMIEGSQKLTKQSLIGRGYRITLLDFGYDTDIQEQPPEPETTGPEEVQSPPAVTNSPTLPDVGKDSFYYELAPDQPFYINKVSMFQIELTDENGFLASKLGLGTTDVVILEDCIWGDSLITFRNRDNFYSCLSNGWSRNRKTGGCTWDFSTHKYVEGFCIVKNIAQENYGFYVDLDAEGQAFAFRCGETENGGNRVDQNVKVISSTVISNEASSFTLSELQAYFNDGKVPDNTTPPTQPQDPPKVEQPAYTYEIYTGGEYIFSLDSEGAFIFHHVSGQYVDYKKGIYLLQEDSLELVFYQEGDITETKICELTPNGFIYNGTEFVKEDSQDLELSTHSLEKSAV